MSKFELEWTMSGTVVVEADDADEADDLMRDGLANFDTMAFDEFAVDEIRTDSVERMGPGE